MAFGRSNSLSLNTGATNSLFASQNNNTTTNNNPSNMNSSQQPASNPFGSSSNTTGGLFGLGGGGMGSMAANSNTNMFAQSANNNNNASTANNNASSLFGGASMQNNSAAQPSAPSLLGATQHNRTSTATATPFGRLSMGQPSASTTNNNTVGAAKIDLDGLRPTTRFEDCVDQVRQEMETIDKMIQEQEKYAKEIEAFLPKHADDVASLAPDVLFIADKADDVEQALASDAQGVDAQRKNAEKDRKDLERCTRIVTNLSLPQGYQYSGMNSTYGSMYGQQRPQQPPNTTNVSNREDSTNYDTDLIGNYFVPLAAELQKTMDAYASNLSEIESHMRVIESSAVAQAQQLAQKKAGVGGQQSGGDATVRELADTLRGFEDSILGVASVVGECRDGVNELALGRLRA
ncbi:uncharacterized protein RCC_06063 [Ramularia collo-cygni]|uniref:Nucleoporin NUP49/NSP49 n=1 Tax=Ramularia collo-cygni TaxID=112498 RepID=A0A2D3V987_9PEZI|nr:uncharacterized protein RCC_06063 [Ramularia collo-cygni]CZT20206.1 uncharacterized protein RCC_06063 [Ramularia collo-cygni]